MEMQIRRLERERRRLWIVWPALLVFAWIFLTTSSSNPSQDSSSSSNMASSTKKDTDRGATNKLLVNYKLVEDTSHNKKVLRYAAQHTLNGGTISVSQWAQFLTNNPTELSSFVHLLQDAPMKAFFFETKGVNSKTVDKTAFEFVLVESSYLYQFADAAQDADTFREHFENCNNNKDNNNYGCVFANLGGDSLLIAPQPLVSEQANTNIYGHLAAFVRRAPEEQVLQVWKLTLETYVNRITTEQEDCKVWLSTDGTGVAWLHLRLDPRPKYYDYEPFAHDDNSDRRLLSSSQIGRDIPIMDGSSDTMNDETSSLGSSSAS